ncbi:MAG: SAM-dependent DNA methyltransferase, partial [Chlorobiota bacterium]
MDKGKLKNFAGEARKRLIDHTGARIRYILTHETPELAAKADLKEKLRAAWENTPDRDEFIERHAYTLFNRLIALRYMDVKGYNFVPVVSPRVEGGDPAILADARKGLLPAGLPVDAARVKALLSGEVPAVNPFNEAYKLLFIAACAGFNKTMPFMFEPLNSYTEILLPDDLLSANSILAFVNENLGEEECENVEVIGWLYQFYISEKKDAVFADKKNAAKRKKDEIAAITQLFTPAWIVKYLVENGLGKLWMLNNPASPLQQQMSYYLPTELVKDEVPEIKSPEEIKILDPCAGSGHTLVYAFDLLFKIYEESGYYRTDIPALILRNNLTGLELDNRAAALADFALMMKAMEYDRNFLTRGVLPKVYSLNDERIIHTWEVEGAGLTKKETQKAEFLASFFKDADILGSLLDPGFTRNAAQAEFFHDEAKKEEIESRYDEETTTVTPVREKVEFSAEVYNALSDKYHFTVTNPPYLPGNSNPV